MEYCAEYAPRALDDLLKMERKAARLVIRKINAYCDSGRPLSFAKPLKGDLAGAYRFRIGDYRVIFDLGKRNRVVILFVLRVGHRRDIYG